LPIRFPTRHEQARIIQILDVSMSTILDTRRLTVQAESALTKIQRSAIQEVFVRSRNTSLKTLPEISTNLDGRRRPITKCDRVPGPFPYYGASGVVDHVDGYIFDEPLLLVSEDGANLIARSTPIAFSAEGKFWVNNHAHVLRFSGKYLREYVSSYLNLIPLDDWVTGAAQPKLNQGALNRIPIPVPQDANEVVAVVQQINDLRTTAEKIERNFASRLVAIDELKRATIQAAFRGEL